MPDLKTNLIKVPTRKQKLKQRNIVGQLQPEAAVVTSAGGNPYHHPSDEVLERYNKTGAHIFRRIVTGRVTLGVNGEKLMKTME